MTKKRPKLSTFTPLGSIGTVRKYGFIGIILFLVLWIVLSSTKIVSPLILPSPIRVITSVNDVGIILLLHLVATLTRTIVGFILGSLFGIGLGMAMQYNRFIYTMFDGLIETFRPVPPVALIPFFILIFGFSELGKLIIVTLGVGLIMVVNTIEAVERIPTGVMRWGLVLGLHRKELFTKIIIPSAWPEMRSGARIAMALSITLVVVSEFMGAKYGLGYLINISKITLTTPTIILSVILLGWLGWVLDRVIRTIFDKTCTWDVRAKGAMR
jgi:ABC-type nitrate/sulfonate/bicarbonate transport system permease component